MTLMFPTSHPASGVASGLVDEVGLFDGVVCRILSVDHYDHVVVTRCHRIDRDHAAWSWR